MTSLSDGSEVRHVNLLVADDEEGIVDLLCMMLGDVVDGVHIALTCEEARDVAREARIDIALLDVRMPRMGGIRLVDELRALNPEIRVLMLSGCDDEDVVREAMALHVEGFIEKPFEPDEVRASVTRLVAKVRAE